MKRYLYLIRHAKSDWPQPQLSDTDRGLNARGKRDVKKMGVYLAKQKISFDKVVCSPALRTTLTAQGLVADMDYTQKDIIYDDDLYMASMGTVMETIVTTGRTVKHLAIVSHNPTLTLLVNELGVQLDNLPTCGIVCFSSKQAWSDVSFEYERFVSPKSL